MGMMQPGGRVHLFISGLVQGVFFRANTQTKAEELGVSGWVKNLADGRVEVVAEGEMKKLEELVAWSRQGPSGARIDTVEVGWEEATGEFSRFQIRR
jgi:acylphosphatase